MTICYADYTGHLYVKSDIYSFGVVLVEMLIGLQALYTNRPSGKQDLVGWIKPYLSKIIKLKQIMDCLGENIHPRMHSIYLSLL